jgi:hypothetical protein
MIKYQPILFKKNMIEKYHSSTEYIFNELAEIRTIPKGINKTEDLINSAEKLFGFLPNDNDERWQIASIYNTANKKHEIIPVNLENGLLAIYLSNQVSFRNAIMAYTHEPNIRQLTRAVVNLNNFDFLKEKFKNVNNNLINDFSIEFALTNHIKKGVDERGITGCPEALYQLRLFDEKKYIARIGFNVHMEEKNKIISIVNIQGVPGKIQLYKDIIEEYKVKPFNILIQKLKRSLSNEENVIFRGLKNPKNKESSALYNATLDAEGIKKFSYKKEKISNYCDEI